MEYKIIIEKVEYSIKYDAVNGLTINSKKYEINPANGELNGWALDSYMAKCVQKHNNVDYLSWKNSGELKDMYDKISVNLDESVKADILSECYIDQNLEIIFPGLDDYVNMNVAFSMLLTTVVYNITKRKLPKVPYDKGMIIKKKHYSKIYCIGTEKVIYLPTTGSGLDGFDPNQMLY